ncbi:hypothetical protein EYZ11_013391 [Aspergillus tanneri]|uniref:Uncharacterized protein n=1 Tax=Aspergillus tanneri TaxID=1220188 RepID=A0A4S3IXV9_9EURO|nr:hypothetical protein EYZ11_013391 [Aspergillus tanneri]
MFRASLRSVADPLREHVCLSCLAQRPGGRHGLRLFHSTSVSLTEDRHGASEEVSPDAVNPPTQAPVKVRRAPYHPHAPVCSLTWLALKDYVGLPKRPNFPKLPKKGTSPESIPQDRSEKARGRRSKKVRKVASKKSPKGKAGKVSEQGKTADGGKLDSTSRIQSSLQSIVSRLEAQKSPAITEEDEASSLVNAKEVGSLKNKSIVFKALKNVKTPPVPQLSYGLERVLFNPGVYHLRDPRSRVYNFDPYLGSIMPVTEFDFTALKDYITSSKDKTLQTLAQSKCRKYMGSSSSMTSTLSHFHYLLSAWRGIDIRTVSQGFPDKLRTFTRLMRAPTAMFLRYQGGVYAIDADKEFDSANILMNLGKSMEKLLTLPKEDFERYRRSSENKISPEEEQAVPEAYHYSTIDDFLMRSQLDAYDPRLPGTGMFDLKTRAVVSIRMDARNFEHGLGYEIQGRFGAYESYEREYYDMIRAAFLKYSLQVRIGRMDGIFVAFHNIERIFGFQYVSLPEMDLALHGQSDTSLGDYEFKLSVSLWNKVLDKVTEKFPKQNTRLHFETRDAQTPFMYVFAEPVTEDEIHAIQTKNQEEIDAYQRRILDLAPHEQETSSSGDSAQETPLSVPDSQAPGSNVTKSSEPLSDATYDSSAPPDESFLSDLEGGSAENSEDDGKELMAMTVKIRNKVNGKYVERPTDLKESDLWIVEYEINELKGPRVRSLYAACQKRRAKALAGRGEDETDVAGNVYIRKLREISQQGRLFRKEEDRKDEKKGVVVLDSSP